MSRYRIPPGVVSEVLDGEAVVLHADSGVYFSLNRSATRMWQLLCELGDAERICSALELEFDAGRADLAADLERLVTELESRGLLAREE
jgi:hypothetical protein